MTRFAPTMEAASPSMLRGSAGPSAALNTLPVREPNRKC
jgi:hypothetical protein